jgi:hypothetical protein
MDEVGLAKADEVIDALPNLMNNFLMMTVK